jgi:hypothetical protein
MKKITITILTIMLSGAMFVACKKKDDPKPSNPQNPNEQELITTLKLILTEDGTTNVSTFQFADLDGPGGNPPTQDNILLSANKTYHGRIVLLDQTKNPVDSVSNEVEEKKDIHEFFFTPAGVNITSTYTDFDTHGVPVGLYPDFATGAASTGTLKITLKHQPGLKPTSGNGDITIGETDIEVTFNVSVL